MLIDDLPRLSDNDRDAFPTNRRTPTASYFRVIMVCKSYVCGEPVAAQWLPGATPMFGLLPMTQNLTTTTQLVRNYQGGDRSALEVLYGRYMPMLRRWASGRLPPHGRDVAETEDLVQMAFMRAFKHMDTFEVQHPGSFLVYLRSIMMNLVRDELRRKKVRPQALSVLESLPDTGTSLVEAAVGAEMLANYERALSKLPEEKRSAVMMRVEFDLSYQEIASELELPSANATRMLISRALVELAGHMQT